MWCESESTTGSHCPRSPHSGVRTWHLTWSRQSSRTCRFLLLPRGSRSFWSLTHPSRWPMSWVCCCTSAVTASTTVYARSTRSTFWKAWNREGNSRSSRSRLNLRRVLAVERPRIRRPPSRSLTLSQKGDWPKALDVFAKMPNLPQVPLSSDCYFGLAQAAVKKADYRQAVRALKAVMTSAPDDPIAPRACFLLARIYSERLSDLGTAEQLFRHVVQRYPKSQEAQFAQTRLGRKTEPSTA